MRNHFEATCRSANLEEDFMHEEKVDSTIFSSGISPISFIWNTPGPFGNTDGRIWTLIGIGSAMVIDPIGFSLGAPPTDRTDSF